MALVAYDYESGSDSESEIDESGGVVVIANQSENHKSEDPSPKPTLISTNSDNENKTNLFSNLPQSKTVSSKIEEDQIEDFIPRPKPVKEKQKVKISIPVLSQLDADEDDEPDCKRPKQSAKGCGLISLLPPVKGSLLTAKSFVPNVIANKSKNSNSSSSTASSSSFVPNVLRKKAEAKKAQLVKKLSAETSKASSSDVESDDEIDVPYTFDEEMWEKVCGRPKPKPTVIVPEEPIQEVIDIAPEPSKPYDGLDNEAFKELVGKTKRPLCNIKLIDINEEEILPDKDLWMTKSLTDPGMKPKAQIEDPVDPTRRKKHHITYLAQQAKANEQELQAAWSTSKNNRMASRAKYGF